MPKELSEDLRIINMYEKWACVTNPFKGVFGRKKLFNRNDMYILQSLIKDKESLEKKLQKEAYERSEIIHAHYLGVIGESYIPNQLIFIDKSAKDERSLSRFYGYSPWNIRACKKVVFVRGKRYTILPALTLDGFVIVDIFEGACNKKRFIDLYLIKYTNGSQISCSWIAIDEMVQFMIKERKDNNDYYHTLVKGRKRMFWEDVVMKVNLKYKSRFIGSQVKEKFQEIIRDCRLMKMYIDGDSKGKKTRNRELYYEQFEDFFGKKKRRKEIVTLSEERNLEEEDEDHI
ncbi:homeodomain-like protein [Rhizophagus clarus]|uniref:Homeodomain-like protein n=1 Tax=Rhizophagus clarus TaxID=94130 RepID=A0A8H3LU35_9GLOM|nr:homeodomain-like protein [Rhizophagus clarus]